MKKQTVGVFFGSRSTEHDVSIVTAISSVIKPLKLSGKYNVVPVHIAKDGKWYTDPKLADIATYTSGEIESLLKKIKPVAIEIGEGLRLVQTGLRNKTITIDIAFPATHGTHGEDGEVMALFELANIPYVGCNVPASAVAMDKVLAKQVAASQGISVTKFIAASKADYEAEPKKWLARIEKELRYPLFVKPPHLGSSIGISKVANKTELENAIEVALHYDDKVLVEEGVQNLIEVTLPIMGNEEPVPALLEQPLTHAEDFFDFDTKYMQGSKKGKGSKNAKSGSQGYSQIPADLPKKLYKAAEETGIATYKALGCSGIARVDMLIDTKKQTIYFNEVNPLPGGLYAHNWNKAGYSNIELVQKLISYAESLHKEKTARTTNFSTNYLKQF
jgi:D-alanine-D-alanine ligase